MIEIRPSAMDDLPALEALYEQAQHWLTGKGLDQWQPPADDTGQLRERISRGITRAIERGTCYVAEQGPSIVGTITVDEYADPEFWNEQDDPASALYVHRMIIARSASGQCLGGQLLDWAARHAEQCGKKWIRLDAWRTNGDLQRYYRSEGMTLVRVVSLDHRGSGALFQRAVR